MALLYTGTSLPTLLVMGRSSERAAACSLLQQLGPALPSRFYAHLVPGSADALRGSFELEAHGVHDRMVLAERARLEVVDTDEAVALKKRDQDELVAFFAAAYPGNWFDPRMLETDAYFGVRRGGELLCVAGVHTVSRLHRVAALGNIATLPSARGQGLGRIATAAVCKSLPEAATIGLNVAVDNAAAIALYRRLGFAHVTPYEEHMATRVATRR
jgi:ribosomal protein S18 acetylase RimI-like enzyme